MTLLVLERILLVGAGGFLGAISRFGIFMLAKPLFKQGIPLGALSVNILGCLLVGIIAFFILHKNFEGHKFVETFLITGFLGSFTTFSAFSLDVLRLIQDHDYMTAGWVIAGNVILSIAAVFIGFYFAARLYS